MPSPCSYGVAYADSVVSPTRHAQWLIALIAAVIGVVFFTTSHPLRGTALLILAALAAGYGLVSARRGLSANS